MGSRVAFGASVLGLGSRKDWVGENRQLNCSGLACSGRAHQGAHLVSGGEGHLFSINSRNNFIQKGNQSSQAAKALIPEASEACKPAKIDRSLHGAAHTSSKHTTMSAFEGSMGAVSIETIDEPDDFIIANGQLSPTFSWDELADVRLAHGGGGGAAMTTGQRTGSMIQPVQFFGVTLPKVTTLLRAAQELKPDSAPAQQLRQFVLDRAVENGGVKSDFVALQILLVYPGVVGWPPLLSWPLPSKRGANDPMLSLCRRALLASIWWTSLLGCCWTRY